VNDAFSLPTTTDARGLRENEQRELFTPDVGRVLALVFGVTLLLGLVSGALWIAWNLLRLHVFR